MDSNLKTNVATPFMYSLISAITTAPNVYHREKAVAYATAAVDNLVSEKLLPPDLASLWYDSIKSAQH